jgi:hypothetical protein
MSMRRRQRGGTGSWGVGMTIPHLSLGMESSFILDDKSHTHTLTYIHIHHAHMHTYTLLDVIHTHTHTHTHKQIT